MNDELIQRLRGLYLCQHSDFSIGNEAADEIKRLREELAARDLVIEQMRKALKDWSNLSQHALIESGVCCCGESIDGHSSPMIAGHNPLDSGAYHAERLMQRTESCIALQPPTDALKLRDQHRDAALLRAAAKKFYTVNLIKIFEDLATKRLSGEWEPELEIKS